MAPSLTRVINAVFNMVAASNHPYAMGVLNATISVRERSASLILVADGTEMTASMNELLGTATEQGVPVVTVQSSESLGTAFGYTALSVVSINGSEEHVPVVVNLIQEAIAAGPGVDEGSPAA